jgi:hypothetical protein
MDVKTLKLLLTAVPDNAEVFVPTEFFPDNFGDQAGEVAGEQSMFMIVIGDPMDDEDCPPYSGDVRFEPIDNEEYTEREKNHTLLEDCRSRKYKEIR